MTELDKVKLIMDDLERTAREHDECSRRLTVRAELDRRLASELRAYADRLGEKYLNPTLHVEPGDK